MQPDSSIPLGDISRRRFLLSAPAGAALAAAAQGAVKPPSPYGALPSDRQLHWHELDLYAFLHFTMNTFTDKEWGYGDEDPKTFHPAEFDADAIILGLKAGGMRGAILTCKHHDGFCLGRPRRPNTVCAAVPGEAARETS